MIVIIIIIIKIIIITMWCRLGLRLMPRRGDAVLFYNLRREIIITIITIIIIIIIIIII